MRFLFTLGFLYFLSSCSNSTEQRYRIEGTVSGGAGKSIYLQELSESNQFIIIDSAVIDSMGKFVLDQGAFTSYDFYRLTLAGKELGLTLIPDEEPIQLKLNYSQFPFQTEFLSGVNSKSIQRISDSTGYWYAKSMLYSKRNDSTTVDLANLEKKNIKDYLFSFLVTHPHDLVGFYAFTQLFDFSLVQKEDLPSLQKFIQGFSEQHPKHRYIVMLNQLISPLKRELDGLRKDELVQVGSRLPELALKNQNDSLVSIHQTFASYRVIDFWAGWCEPCMNDLPRVKRTEDKYKRQSVEFLGISLDEDRNTWLEAIQQKKMTWLQVSDLQRWNSAAVKTYGIRSLPTYIVVDSNSLVIKKTIDFNEVTQLLDSLTRNR
jgi:thiol-disulfide isomerase/thioredoxin